MRRLKRNESVLVENRKLNQYNFIYMVLSYKLNVAQKRVKTVKVGMKTTHLILLMRFHTS